MQKKSIFIAATGQNVGKTTICLGVIAALNQRFSKVGFIKPVGQRHQTIEPGIEVDKDVRLFKMHFNMSSDWKDMSPVIIPSGFTRRYLNGEMCENQMLETIIASYARIASEHDYTIVEGTGHVGVGSIINLSNAKVAAALNLDMIIIADGGLGSSFDELALNVAMCEHYDVKVRGVILNRVLKEKREMILEYFPKALKRWNIPLIGCIPYDPFLSKPTVKDYERLFNTTLFSGAQHQYRHFNTVRLFAGSLQAYLREMEPNQMIITPASREDIIKATLDKHIEVAEQDGSDYEGGMILTGRHSPSPEIQKQIKEIDLPILYAPMTSYDAMKEITSFIAKISLNDTAKIEKAISLVETHVDMDFMDDMDKNGRYGLD